MKFQTKELRDLFKEGDNNEFVLPNFQRSFVWPVDKQKTLLSTFIVNLPTGNFLTLLGKSGDFSARNVCLSSEVTPSVNCSYLLDGQQRFSVLKNSFQNIFDDDHPEKWKSKWDILFAKLRFRYFLNVKSHDNMDYFGFSNLSFTKTIIDHLEPSLLKDLIKEKEILAKNISDYFHPGFNPVDTKKKPLSKAQRRSLVSKFMAEEFLVPLYEICDSTSQSLHNKVLGKIAQNRCEELQDEFDGNKKSIIEILSPVDENIADYLKTKDKEAIKRTWMQLQTKWATDVSKFLEGLLNNHIFEIELKREETSRAFAIFEVINLPGTPLHEYDLIVARAAKNKERQLTLRLLEILNKEFELPKSLTSKINGNKPKKSMPSEMGCINKDNELAGDVKVRFLQMLTVISFCINTKDPENLGIEHLKRDKFLSLTEAQINANYQLSLNSVVRAFHFLRFRCGIRSIEELPYKLMLLPIAYVLIDENIWKNEKALNRIEYWYWVSLFGGSYRLDQNSRAKEDMIKLKNFIKNKDTSEDEYTKGRYHKVLNVPEYSDEKVLLCKEKDFDIPFSIQKGILQYILSNQPYDFFEENSKNARLNSWDYISSTDDKFTLEDHHICPLAEKRTMKETSTKVIRDNKKEVLNSPVNRTLISKAANRKIGSFSPDEYFKYVSDASKFGHFVREPIEKEYVKGKSESEDNYYDRVCGGRYQELLSGIKKELLALIDK